MIKYHTDDKTNRNLKSNFLHKTSPYTIFHIIQVILHTIQPILGCQSQYFILHCRQVKQSTQNGIVSKLQLYEYHLQADCLTSGSAQARPLHSTYMYNYGSTFTFTPSPPYKSDM